MSTALVLPCPWCGRDTTARELDHNGDQCHACAVAEERERQVAEAERAEERRRERDFEDNGPRGNNQ